MFSNFGSKTVNFCGGTEFVLILLVLILTGSGAAKIPRFGLFLLKKLFSGSKLGFLSGRTIYAKFFLLCVTSGSWSAFMTGERDSFLFFSIWTNFVKKFPRGFFWMFVKVGGCMGLNMHFLLRRGRQQWRLFWKAVKDFYDKGLIWIPFEVCCYCWSIKLLDQSIKMQWTLQESCYRGFFRYAAATWGCSGILKQVRIRRWLQMLKKSAWGLLWMLVDPHSRGCSWECWFLHDSRGPAGMDFNQKTGQQTKVNIRGKSGFFGRIKGQIWNGLMGSFRLEIILERGSLKGIYLMQFWDKKKPNCRGQFGHSKTWQFLICCGIWQLQRSMLRWLFMEL